MKKVILLIVAVFAMNFAFSQATKQLNFGLIGASFDIPVHADIAIAPMARTDFNLNHLVLGVKADYYFDNLIGLPSEWDFYAGLNAGYKIWLHDDNYYNDNKNYNNGHFDLGLEVGGRWFWSEKWGLNLELSGGIGYGGMLGLTMRL